MLVSWTEFETKLLQLGDQILLSKDQLELLKMLHNHLNILLLIYTRIQLKIT